MTSKSLYLKCDDNAETVVFTKYGEKDGNADYEINVEDSYCGGDYMGISGRFKRAWKAFWAKPIYYTGVYIEDEGRVKKFLEDCLDMVNEINEITWPDCPDDCVHMAADSGCALKEQCRVRLCDTEDCRVGTPSKYMKPQ